MRNNWGLIVAFFALIIGIGIFAGRSNSTLPAYVEEEVEEQEVEETVDIELDTFTEEETGLTIGIPKGFQYVIKSGNPTFIHQSSGASITLEINVYNPYIWSTTRESLISLMPDANIGDVNWLSNDSYITSYSQHKNDGYLYDYIEYCMIDQNNILKVIYVADNNTYTKLEKEITASIESISWERKMPIPEGFSVSFSEFGNFEFGVPMNWNMDVVNGTFFAQEPNTGASVSVTASQSNMSYKDVSQVDYIAWVSSGRQNYNLQDYNHTDNTISALGTYKNGNEIMMFEQHLVCNGSFEYTLTMECTYDSYQDIKPYFESEYRLFRVF